MGAPAARSGDMTTHGTPLAPGPGCPTVLIGGLPAWRAGVDTHVCPLVDGTKPHVGGAVAVGTGMLRQRRIIAHHHTCRGDAAGQLAGSEAVGW